MQYNLPRNKKVKTKTGIEIEFEFFCDDGEKNNKNERWRYHSIEVFTKENNERKNIGYIRLAYIDEQKKKEYFEDILGYAINMANDPRFYKLRKDATLKNLTQEEIESLIPTDKYTEGKTLKQKLKIIERGLKYQHGKGYERFIDYHYMKPEPDYIQVNEEYRNKGVGKEIYKKAIEFLGINGLPFFQSTTQTEEAKRSWESLKKSVKGAEVYESEIRTNDKLKERFFIDHSHLKEKLDSKRKIKIKP